MAKSTASKMASLVLRIVTLILLLISLIVICTNTKIDSFNNVKIKFQDVKSYRYMVSTIVIGIAYAILQLAFTIYTVISKNNNGNLLLDFYGDKIMSYILATGAAAGFAVTNDMKTLTEWWTLYDFGDFFAKGYASASLIFLAFVCTAVLSVLSSYALPKDPLAV